MEIDVEVGKIFFMAIIVMLFAGCLVRVKSSYDHSMDFASTKLFVG